MSKLQIALFLFSFLMFSNCTSKKTEAKADYKALTIDFGNRMYGDTIDVVFSLKNIGDKDWEIDTVIAGCQCTVANYRKTLIKPNESSEIQVKYIPTTDQNGKIYKEIIVKSNAIKKIQLLSITGNVSKI